MVLGVIIPTARSPNRFVVRWKIKDGELSISSYVVLCCVQLCSVKFSYVF